MTKGTRDGERNKDSAAVGALTDGRPRRRILVWTGICVLAVVVLVVGGVVWGISATSTSKWKPGSIGNLVMSAGSRAMAAGNGYKQISTRSKDPRPLAKSELDGVLQPGGSIDRVGLTSDCASVVTGRAVVRALVAGGCTQVMRAVVTARYDSGGPSAGLIDIFNLKSGSAVYRAARQFGGETLNGEPPGAEPTGFIRSWPGTSAANLAGADGNAAYVVGYGHFLFVIWVGGGTYGEDGNTAADDQFDSGMQQFVENRLASIPGQSMYR